MIVKFYVSLIATLLLHTHVYADEKNSTLEWINTKDKDVKEFKNSILTGIFFADQSNNACDSVGIMPHQKIAFAKEFNCSEDSVNKSNIIENLEKKLGMNRHSKNFIEFQKDAALLAISFRYEADLKKQTSYLSDLRHDFDLLSRNEMPNINSETYFILPDAMETIRTLVIPAVIGEKKSSANINFEEIFSYAVAASPLLSFIKDDLKKYILESHYRSGNDTVIPEDFSAVKIAELLMKATTKSREYIYKETTETTSFMNLMKSKYLSRGDEYRLEQLKRKLTEKLVVNNPKLAAEVIDGIVLTSHGSEYKPTSYAVLARGLCELESKYYEKKANDVKNDFLLHSALTPVTFIGGGVGALFIVGSTIYSLGKTVPEAFHACIEMKNQFEKQNALELTEALKKPISEMGDPPSASEAQALALAECTRSASRQMGLAVAQTALAAAGLGALSKNISKVTEASKITSFLSSHGKTIEKTALWGGRGLGALGVGLASNEVYKNCFGKSIDEEACRVAKLQLALAGVTLVGSEVNLKYRNRLAKKERYKQDEIDEQEIIKKEELLKKQQENKLNPPMPKKVIVNTTDIQKNRFFKNMRESSAHTHFEAKNIQDKGEVFSTLQVGDEIKYFDPHMKKELTLYYVGNEDGMKVFIKEPSLYLGGVRLKYSNAIEFNNSTGAEDPIFISKSNDVPSWEGTKRIQLPQNGNFLTFNGKDGKQKINFPARVIMDDREQISTNGQALKLPSNNKKLVNEVVVLSRFKDSYRDPKTDRLNVKEYLFVMMPDGKVRKVQVGSIGGNDRTSITPFFTGNPDENQEVVPLLDTGKLKLPGRSD